MKKKYSSAVMVACLTLLSRPSRAVELEAPVIAAVPDLAVHMPLGGANLGAVAVIPAAVSLTAVSLPMIAAPAAIAQDAFIGQPGAALAAAAPAAEPAAPAAAASAQAASAVGNVPADAAGAGKETVLAALQERVAALSKPDAQPEREITRLYEGGNVGGDVALESSPESAARSDIMNTKMATLKDAIALATKAHAGQKDWGGIAYVEHPLRVMGRLTTDEEKMTGVLHDVVEDTPVTLDDLRAAGYPESVVEAVDAMTRRKGETYEDYMARVELNSIARKVKVADLEDNMNLNRLSDPQQRAYDASQKYRHYWRELTALEIADSRAPKSVFKFYAVFTTKHEIRGLFAFHRGGNRLDSLAWNHQSKRWEDDHDISGRYFFKDVDAEEVSPARAAEIASRFGARVPADSELMKISDDAEAGRQSDHK